jgi:hypothetical protein
MIEATSDYYGRRADEQAAHRRQAATQKAAVVHFELAVRYALLSSPSGTASYPADSA